jgi:hypothetical protein
VESGEWADPVGAVAGVAEPGAAAPQADHAIDGKASGVGGDQLALANVVLIRAVQIDPGDVASLAGHCRLSFALAAALATGHDTLFALAALKRP